jgi:ribosomal protein S18 acetylase RimI-like enzyme
MVKLLLSLLAIGFSQTTDGTPYDFQRYGISYVWETEPDIGVAKKIATRAFTKCYEGSLKALNLPSKEALVKWLDLWDKSFERFKQSNELWLSAKDNDMQVGFLIIDAEKDPEEIYLSELAIDPEYQGRGIASTMIRSIFSQFPECKRFLVITRKINKEAIGLYNALGFVPSTYMHEGFSREFFTGFEYIND